MKFTVVVFALLAFAIAANANEIADSWSSVRAQGLGGAYTAIVNNSDALFYNPAGLANQTKFAWTVLDPRGGLNGVDNIQLLQAAISDQANMAANLQKLYGKRVWVEAGAKTAIMVPNFAASAFANGVAGVYVANPANTTMNLNYFFDYGFAAGGGFDLVPGVIKFGLTAKRVNRTGTTVPIGASTLATLDTNALQAELKRRGTGYSADLGMLMTLPGPVAPSLSLVYRNAGTTTFSHEEGAGAPPPIDSEFVVGGAFKISGGLIDITPVLDYRFANRTDIAVGKKLHLGVEVGLPLIDLRAGLNQGYYSAGVGLNLGLMHIDAATYGVELGAYPGQLEDRRYVAQLTIELGFDTGFLGLGGSSSSSSSSDGNSGPHHRLKQRR